MELLSSYEQITHINNTIKSSKEFFLTNFFIGEERCNLLIKKNLLYVIDYEKCAFILYKDHDFYHHYFICSNENVLIDSLKKLVTDYSDCIFVTDIVGIEAKVQQLVTIFGQTGFTKYTSLYRMSRVKNIDNVQNCDPQVEFAVLDYAGQIHNLFEKYFDKYSEQIPLLDEIIQFIDNRNIFVITEQQKILGFVIFEKIGVTSYLRYWFVLPEYRDRKIGSVLLRRFFYECHDTKRQIFWVLASNENAIIKYRHYGFETETMFDQVMIRS